MPFLTFNSVRAELHCLFVCCIMISFIKFFYYLGLFRHTKRHDAPGQVIMPSGPLTMIDHNEVRYSKI